MTTNIQMDMLLKALDAYLAKPVIVCINQAFDNDLFDKLDKTINTRNTAKFRDYLQKLIDSKNITDIPDLYGKAGISKSVFSRLTNYTKDYHPSKATVAGLSIALKLDINEAIDFFNAAGYHLTESVLFDKVVRFAIEHKVSDAKELNLFLEHVHLRPIGY